MLCGDHKGAHRIFKIAFATFSVIGLVGSLMLFFGAHVISNYWLQIPEAEMTLVALSPAIFFVAISSVMRGYFNGRQKKKKKKRSQSIEQVFKTALIQKSSEFCKEIGGCAHAFLSQSILPAHR